MSATPGTPARSTPAATPSRPDPVESWLDLVTSMLALPPAERRRVRDELEDHLRSRVDDLLITGLSEPDALRQAVAELGETAELARQITQAHRAPVHRRRTMQLSLLALAGSAVLATLALVRSPGVPPLGAAPAVVASDPPGPAAVFDSRGATYGSLIEAFRASTDIPVLVHWASLDELGIDPTQPLPLDAPSMPISAVFDALAEHWLFETRNAIVIARSPAVIEISTRSMFDARTLRVSYELAGLLADPPYAIEPVDILDALQDHVSEDDWTDRGGSVATASILGTVMLITAPQRIHEDIERFLADMARRQDERREAARAATAELAAERDRLIDRLGTLDASLAQAEERIARFPFTEDGADAEMRSASFRDRRRFQAEQAELDRRLQVLSAELAHLPIASLGDPATGDTPPSGN